MTDSISFDARPSRGPVAVLGTIDGTEFQTVLERSGKLLEPLGDRL